MNPLRPAFCLLIILVFAAGGSAQSNSKSTFPRITEETSDIRKVSFETFNYGPLCPGYHKFLPVPDSNLILRKGNQQFGDEMNYANLGSVKYVDFDGDGNVEAFVVINGQTSGSSNAFRAAYVFTYRNGSARRIWSQCEENSAAVLKGRSILFTHPEWVGNAAHCCPTYSTTDTYRWKGSGFVRISKRRKRNG